MVMWETYWEGHSIRALMDSRGGWPGLGLLGGSNYYILYVDALCAAKLKVSQAGDLFGGLSGKKLVLAGKFKSKAGSILPVSVEIPLAGSSCQFKIGDGPPLTARGERIPIRQDVEEFEKLEVVDPSNGWPGSMS